jgi:HPt (histidine-containing phosphotransfer) domain-containing protein
MRRITHPCQSSAAIVSASTIQQKAKQLETTCNHGDQDTIAYILAQRETENLTVLAAYREYRTK